MQGRVKGDQTKRSEWLSVNLGKAAGNQPPLEVVQVVAEETCRLAGLLLWAFFPRVLLISNPPHLWRQEIDSVPLRIRNVALLGKACRNLC